MKKALPIRSRRCLCAGPCDAAGHGAVGGHRPSAAAGEEATRPHSALKKWGMDQPRKSDNAPHRILMAMLN